MSIAYVTKLELADQTSHMVAILRLFNSSSTTWTYLPAITKHHLLEFGI